MTKCTMNTYDERLVDVTLLRSNTCAQTESKTSPSKLYSIATRGEVKKSRLFSLSRSVSLSLPSAWQESFDRRGAPC